MQKIDKLGSAKRFGSRYGTKTKHKFAKIEKEQRKKHKCPYCHYTAVRRLALGIWLCKKCDSKFTGKAYTIAKPIIPKGSAKEKVEEKNLAEEESVEDLQLSEEETSEEEKIVKVEEKA
jgi:large subunit ribosomal protein L37Ae|tara:strand:+ start:698 stop:1054 length:357 start_codon:yes stop_codon:yes gene_type:complete